MEDLRKDYNVSSTPKRKSIWLNISLNNNSYVKFLFLLIVLSFIIFKPKVIGEYSGKWFNDLTQSFLSNILLTADQWYLILITVFSIIICYTIVKWINRY